MSNVIPLPGKRTGYQPPLIGIGGKLGAGKDALAEHIAEHYGATVLNMSAPLVRAMLVLNPLVPTYVKGTNVEWVATGRTVRYRDLHESVGYVKAKENPEVRRLYQVLGTQVGRDMISQNVWVDIARRDIQTLREDGETTLITGIRFPNELEMILGQGGSTVWVERDPNYQSEAAEALALAKSEAGGHASENSVGYRDFGLVVENFGTLDGLYASAETLYEDIVRQAARQHPAGTGHGTRYDW